jgi:hypothetical protein
MKNLLVEDILLKDLAASSEDEAIIFNALFTILNKLI